MFWDEQNDKTALGIIAHLLIYMVINILPIASPPMPYGMIHKSLTLSMYATVIIRYC